MSSDTASQETSYDRVPYSALSFPQQSPARLGAIAALFGVKPVSPAKCRVLELGCGQGLTALTLAQLYPNSEIVAVDLSATQIANAKRLQEKAGIPNVRFEACSITDISKETHGEFDYITCHGVFSWVPQAVRDKILAICGEQLTPQGVAFISFNAMPGWGPLKALREIFTYHSARYDNPVEKYEKCKALVGLMKDFNAPQGNSWTAQFFKYGASLVDAAKPSYFLHEYLEEENTPLYFHEFMTMAEPQGLQFISEYQIHLSMASSLGPQFGNLVEFLKRSPADGQQYIDFFRNTQFHSTLLCKAGIELDRSLQNVNMARFLFASSPKPDAPVALAADKLAKFTFANGATYNASDPLLKAALLFLQSRPNVFVSLSELTEGAAAILEKHGGKQNLDPNKIPPQVIQMVSQLLGAGLAEISLPEAGNYRASPMVTEKPLAPPLARAEAQMQLPVLRTSLYSVPLGEDAAAILPYCDGTRTQNELFAVYRQLIAEGKLPGPTPIRHDQAPNLGGAFGTLLREMMEGGLFWTSSVP